MDGGDTLVACAKAEQRKRALEKARERMAEAKRAKAEEGLVQLKKK